MKLRRGLCLLAAISLMAGGCGGGDDDNTKAGSDDDNTKAACQVGSAAFGLIAAKLTEGRSLEDIGKALSSQGFGTLASFGCYGVVSTWINEPSKPVSLTVTLQSGNTTSETVPGSAFVNRQSACAKWVADIRELCLNGWNPNAGG